MRMIAEKNLWKNKTEAVSRTAYLDNVGQLRLIFRGAVANGRVQTFMGRLLCACCFDPHTSSNYVFLGAWCLSGVQVPTTSGYAVADCVLRVFPSLRPILLGESPFWLSVGTVNLS